MLYTKYRPRQFVDVVGQDATIQILKNAIQQGKVSHSYLFTGPRGTGKTTMARLMAKALNCQKPTAQGDPCGECVNCQGVDKGTFLDLIEIDAASNRGIDQIRELKERINFAPGVGKYKVYIIDEVHMLTTEAFNALLKTLEEPPAHAIFILATTEPHKVPATILSRCQRHDFRLGTEDNVASRLQSVLDQEGYSIEDEALRLIVQHSGGSYRDALSLLEGVMNTTTQKDDKLSEQAVRQSLGLAELVVVQEFLSKLLARDGTAALELIADIHQQGINLSQFIKELILLVRDKLLSTIREGQSSSGELMQLVGWLLEAETQQKEAVTPTLPLELVIAKFITKSAGTVTVPPPSTPPSTKTRPASIEEPDNKSKKAEKPSVDVSQSVATVAPAAPATLSRELVQQQWPQFVNQLKALNGHLFAFLQRGKVKEVETGQNPIVVWLGVPYAFHKDRIETPSSQALLQKVAVSLWQQPVQIRCEIMSGEPDSSNREVMTVTDTSESSSQNDILDVFGSDLKLSE